MAGMDWIALSSAAVATFPAVAEGFAPTLLYPGMSSSSGSAVAGLPRRSLGLVASLTPLSEAGSCAGFVGGVRLSDAGLLDF